MRSVLWRRLPGDYWQSHRNILLWYFHTARAATWTDDWSLACKETWLSCGYHLLLSLRHFPRPAFKSALTQGWAIPNLVKETGTFKPLKKLCAKLIQETFEFVFNILECFQTNWLPPVAKQVDIVLVSAERHMSGQTKNRHLLNSIPDRLKGNDWPLECVKRKITLFLFFGFCF